jgi:hypothetical protein
VLIFITIFLWRIMNFSGHTIKHIFLFLMHACMHIKLFLSALNSLQTCISHIYNTYMINNISVNISCFVNYNIGWLRLCTCTIDIAKFYCIFIIIVKPWVFVLSCVLCYAFRSHTTTSFFFNFFFCTNRNILLLYCFLHLFFALPKAKLLILHESKNVHDYFYTYFEFYH